MEKSEIVVAIIAVVVVAFFLLNFLTPYGYMPMMGYGGYPMGGYNPMMGYSDERYYPPGCCQGPAEFSSNGEKIYFTGINEKGERIPFTGGPQWLVMHGGSCVNCHGRDGRGGLVPMMCNEKAPDIRYSALTEEEMSDEEIRIAITKGEHDNETLDWCMPRWQMSDEDLNDIIAYLKELG
ncbi:c-type cytochrome [Archaeoglobus fulgidus]|nr:cytochrome c [Archaeoglobus fulgidus]AIG97010.1 Cytochrome c, mono- and diheme variant [Archaeoglobus fulgidus DSM 8774]